MSTLFVFLGKWTFYMPEDCCHMKLEVAYNNWVLSRPIIIFCSPIEHSWSASFYCHTDYKSIITAPVYVEHFCSWTVHYGKIQYQLLAKKYSNSNRKTVQIQLISTLENLIKTTRWKALDFLGKLGNQVKNTYGFKLSKCPSKWWFTM